MRENMQNRSGQLNRLLVLLGAQKKKAVIALCLIGVMVFMWVKVFFKRSPQSAGAASTTVQTGLDVRQNPQLKVSFIDLPEVAGRDDVITRDFFAVSDWQEFVKNGAGNGLGSVEVSIASADGSEEIARRVTGKLKLEAIAIDKNRQTSINGKLLSVGDKLSIEDGAGKYECEVVRIEENAVFVKCGKAQITLKLAQTVEVNP